MAFDFDADPNRVRLSYGTEGLAARQDLLIRSLIRILDFKTRHQWVYQPDAADVWIVAAGAQPPTQALTAKKPYQILTINDDDRVSQNSISRALKSDQIEAVLNYMGQIIAPKLEAKMPSQAPQVSTQNADTFRLTRWPSTTLLGNAKYIRAATLLLNRPMHMTDIVTQSGLAKAECVEFINRLRAAGLLRQSQAQMLSVVASQAATNLAANQQQSLFARIRSRLQQRTFA
jgi:hypothetical protein